MTKPRYNSVTSMKKVETRSKDNQNFWNFILSVFFAIVLCMALWEIWGENGSYPHSISLFDTSLMILASFRITRLLVYDKITRWFRELFVTRRTVLIQGEEHSELIPYPNGLLRTMHDLLGCPWCVGFWSSLIVVFCYFLFPWAWLMILFLAIAGASSVIQMLANLIGWSAELKKTAVKNFDENG